VNGAAPKKQTVPARFARVVGEHSQQIAVSARSGRWTYAELDHYTNFFAAEIINELGEDPGAVALLLEHDGPLIAAILGALKANKLYVALDPNYPTKQLAAMLASSGAKLLLTDESNWRLANTVASKRLKVVLIRTVISFQSTKPFPEIDGKTPAWLMFTSGSTSEPKGIWQNHEGLVQEAESYAAVTGLTPADHVSLLTACALGASGPTLFGTLLNGASLCLFSARAQGLKLLVEWMDHERITVFHCLPMIFRNMVCLAGAKAAFAHTRFVRLGGEPVLRGDVELFRQYCPDDCVFAQSFSSSETGMASTFAMNKGTVLASQRVPVGRAVPGKEIFLVDDRNEPLTNGGEGRIAVRGRGMRQGYWQQPELTERRFRKDTHNPDSQIFFSDDIGRFLPDGSLEHLGRSDLLVKVRGHRVDLGEVEAALMVSGIAREAVVTIHTIGQAEKRLVSFFVPASRTGPSTQNIRRQLRNQLPEYMIPSEFVAMERLPQTAAGKIDRGALPFPNRETKLVLGRSQRSRDVLDKRLTGIWESCLKISPISRKDDFFELGGSSLQSLEILSQIEELFGVSLPASTLLEHNTIEKLSGLLVAQGTVYSPNVLVKLRENGAGSPLFLIHSGQGDVASYGLLVRRLTGRPIYGLQSPGMMGESWPLTDVRAMARLYLREILEQEPAGPFLLAATCMGGMVALEVAQMLVQQGKTVSFLGLMDVPFPLPKTWRKPLWKKVYYTLSTPVNNGWLALRWKTIRGVGLGRSHHFLPAYRRFIVRANGRAARNYQPKIYPGDITFFITTKTHYDNEDPRLMLLPMARTARVVKISGVRGELFRKPMVDELARQMQKAMDASENGGG
jgi:amino acid adenylation domain-containing protein